MEEKRTKPRISDIGLLLYFNDFEEISKIDSRELGELIKKEMMWQLGDAEEPTFEDIRCDCFHSRIKSEIRIRDDNAERRKSYRRKDVKEEVKPVKAEEHPKVTTELPNVNIEDELTVPAHGGRERANPTFEDAVEFIASQDEKWKKELKLNQYSTKYGFDYFQLKEAVERYG